MDETSGGSERERLRRALYRPGASASDVERFQAGAASSDQGTIAASGGATGTSETDGPDGTRPDCRRRRVRLALLAGTLLVAVLAAAGAWIGRHGAPSSASAAPSATRAVATTAPSPVAFDRGVVQYATGPAVPAGDGTFAYTIATGDTELGIASRFHVCVSDVTGGLPLSMQGNYLTPGTPITLRLDYTSIWPDGTVHCTGS